MEQGRLDFVLSKAELEEDAGQAQQQLAATLVELQALAHKHKGSKPGGGLGAVVFQGVPLPVQSRTVGCGLECDHT